MSTNNERKDYSDLLEEIRQISAVEGSCARKPEISDIPQNVYDSYVQTFRQMDELLYDDMAEGVDYSAAIDACIVFFTDLQRKKFPYRILIRSIMGIRSETQLSKIQAHLNTIKEAYATYKLKMMETYAKVLTDSTEYCNYVDAFLGREKEERPSRKRKSESMHLHRLLSDEKIKYVADTEQNMIHDKSCKCVRDILDENVEGLETYSTCYKKCKKCAEKAYIRAGSKDFEEYETYMLLFKTLGVKSESLRKLYIECKYQTRISTMNKRGSSKTYKDNALTVWAGEDTWRIGVVNRGNIRLEHNNYKVLKNCEREFTAGFHVQCDYSYDTGFERALDYIRGYKYESHFISPEVQAKAIKAVSISDKTPDTNTAIQTANISSDAAKETLTAKSKLISKLEVFKRCIKSRFSTGRIKGMKYNDEQPENHEICLYLWEDEKGNRYWNSGMYYKTRNCFRADYEDMMVMVSFEKVIKWMPLNRIGIG